MTAEMANGYFELYRACGAPGADSALVLCGGEAHAGG